MSIENKNKAYFIDLEVSEPKILKIRESFGLKLSFGRFEMSTD